MIKFILTVTILLFSLIVLAQDNEKNIQADFRGKQCNGGSGFCGTLPDTIHKSQNSKMKNFKVLKTSATSLTLELNTSALSIEDQVKFFGKEYSKIGADEKLTFNQDSDYEFSFDVLLYLDIDVRYKYLKKGEYPLKIIADKVQVALTLSKD